MALGRTHPFLQNAPSGSARLRVLTSIQTTPWISLAFARFLVNSRNADRRAHADGASLFDLLGSILCARDDRVVDVLYKLVDILIAHRRLNPEVSPLEIGEHRKHLVPGLNDRYNRNHKIGNRGLQFQRN